MKISIERATLLKAVSQAQSVVERRNTIPILANVLIEAEGATPSASAPLIWISRWLIKSPAWLSGLVPPRFPP